jgi:hypothetical protein
VAFAADGAGGRNGLTVHRVVAVAADGATTTKGDNMRAPDADPLAADRIAGQVIAVLRRGRMVALGAGLRGIGGRVLAALSRRNLTPGLVARRLGHPLQSW